MQKNHDFYKHLVLEKRPIFDILKTVWTSIALVVRNTNNTGKGVSFNYTLQEYKKNNRNPNLKKKQSQTLILGKNNLAARAYLHNEKL